MENDTEKEWFFEDGGITSLGTFNIPLPPPNEPEEKRINYAKYRGDDLLPWRDSISGSITQENPLDVTMALLTTFAPVNHLPKHMQILLAAYATCPSALSYILPILHLWGHSGCGKSSTAKVIDVVHGGKSIINGGSMTYASIRNLIQNKRFQGSGGFESNCLIVLDDVKASKFVGDDTIYSFLRSGYDRSTDLCTRASEKAGEVMEFHTFCPKVLTSVEMLIDRADLSELRRRVIVIPFARAEEESLLELNDFDWSDVDILEAWRNEDVIKKFVRARKSIKASFGKDFSPQDKSIGIDLSATLMALADYAPKECKEWWSKVIEEQKKLTETHKSPMAMLIPSYLSEMLEMKIGQIPTKEVRDLLRDNGISHTDELSALMNREGWELKLGSRGKICWCYTGKGNEQAK